MTMNKDITADPAADRERARTDLLSTPPVEDLRAWVTAKLGLDYGDEATYTLADARSDAREAIKSGRIYPVCYGVADWGWSGVGREGTRIALDLA